MFDQLLIIGIVSDDEIRQFLMLLDPADFDADYQAGET